MIIYVCAENLVQGMIEYQVTSFPDPNAEEWRGVTVFGEFLEDGFLHPLTRTLLEKARKLADDDNDKAQILLIGDGLVASARNYFAYGADRVFVYDDPDLATVESQRYTEVMAHFIDNYKPAAILFPQTELSNHLAACILRYAKAQENKMESLSFREPIIPVGVPNPAHRGELVICEIPEQK